MLAILVVHAQAGHASSRHGTVIPRLRGRSTLVHGVKRLDPSRQLGNTIVAFALRAQGRQVGDGECFALAHQALANAGARSAADYTDITPDGDYIWGQPVSLAAAQPGDILQFRNFHILRRVTIIAHGEDGSTSSIQTLASEERDHHTAIVTANFGTSLTIVEQNVEPLGRIVQQNTIEIASGMRRETGAGTETTTDISVDGYIGVYRPQRLQATVIADATGRGS